MSDVVAPLTPLILSLRYLRTKTGLTQGELGNLVGVDRVTIHRWESGQTRPDYVFVKPLAKILRVPESIIIDALENPAA